MHSFKTLMGLECIISVELIVEPETFPTVKVRELLAPLGFFVKASFCWRTHCERIPVISWHSVQSTWMVDVCDDRHSQLQQSATDVQVGVPSKRQEIKLKDCGFLMSWGPSNKWLEHARVSCLVLVVLLCDDCTVVLSRWMEKKVHSMLLFQGLTIGSWSIASAFCSVGEVLNLTLIEKEAFLFCCCRCCCSRMANFLFATLSLRTFQMLSYLTAILPSINHSF